MPSTCVLVHRIVPGPGGVTPFLANATTAIGASSPTDGYRFRYLCRDGKLKSHPPARIAAFVSEGEARAGTIK
jgi:hypothetical protein